MKFRKLIALLLMGAMLLALSGYTVNLTIDDPDLASLVEEAMASADTEDDAQEGEVYVYGGWYYTVSDGEATIVSTSDAIKAAEVILFPAELGGYPVTAIGANGTAVITNASGWVLIPEGVESIASGSFYDLNRTPGWSFPSTLTDLPETALASCGGTFYAAVCPAAQEMGEATGHEIDLTEMETVTIDGAVYNVPAALADVDLTVYAASEDEDEAAIDVYAAAAAAATVDVPSDSIIDGAVAEGVELPEDVFDEVEDVDGEGTNKYISTMGVETGTTYAVDGCLYEMIYITQNVRYSTKAQIINAVYETEGLVYGEDYDLIRLYNYVHSYSNGPRPGDFHIYTCYLYKSMGDTIDGATTNFEWERAYEHVVDGEDQVIQGDVATLMVQAGETVTVNNLYSCNNTIAYGPSEAANFYGLGSAVLVDGGNSTDYSISSYEDIDFGTDDSSVILNDPTIVGTENVLYAVAGGTAYVYGGRYFGCSSGGHGFYVGMGGKIALNADDFIDEDGQPIIDYETLLTLVDERPGLDLGTAQRTELTEDWNAYAEPVFSEVEDEDIAILVTADETGTALTTDTGGGVIVANRISATTYGRGCAGVYSIGGDESYVFVYNSSLHSNMDAALCSASNGYIFAFNCDLEGVSGIKTRSGGSGTWIGVEAYNSRIICSFDPDAYDFYDLGSDEDSWELDAAIYEDWTWADDTSMVNAPMLNMFVNKTNCTWGDDLTTVQSYWFQDKTTAPQTGEIMACVILTGTAPVTVHSCLFVNENYELYADEGATNYLVAGDNGGSGSIYFYDQNSETKWDLTGESDETTELVGDIYVAELVTMTGPDAGSGPSTVNAYFYNSEWTGKTVNWMQNANLTFDADSTWTITADCGVGDLVLESLDQLSAEEPVTLSVYYSLTVGGEAVTEETTVGNVTIVFAEPLEATQSSTSSASGEASTSASGEAS
ncbi:MAG: hypothetical protein LUE21_04815 [Oscillospiraceae bacterium]|nr:hypothetical protein [Oscillospiraceae bacterium]